MLHHKTIASAVEKYGHLAPRAAHLIEALKADEKAWTEEQVQEIFTAITSPKEGKSEVKENVQPPTLNRLFDKWPGMWKAHKGVKDAKGETFVTEWLFVTEGEAPNKTGIPLAQQQADLFNITRQLRQGKTRTEQLYPAGTKDEIIDVVAKPFEEFKL